MAQVRLIGVEKTFGRTLAVAGLNLEVADGEFLTILGPSGCGKSTTLNLIAGLEHPTSGHIFFDGEEVTARSPRERNVAVVFQSYALYPHLSVFDNIAFPLRLARVNRGEIAERVYKSARLLGIEELLKKKPRELSGGQQQRVALGRALVRNPQVFLLDEPLSNLDIQLRGQMRAELKRLRAELRATFIYVTHDQEEAMILSDRIAVMAAGKVLQCGPPQEIYRNPLNTVVASLIGNPPIIYIAGEVEERRLTLACGGSALHLPVGWNTHLPRRVLVGIRPEDVRVSALPSGGEGRGKVLGVEPLGRETYLQIACGPVEISARVAPDFPARVGDWISFDLPLDRVIFFDPASGTNLGPVEEGATRC
jgi:multiple sugar transport system ATP-binding protein